MTCAHHQSHKLSVSPLHPKLEEPIRTGRGVRDPALPPRVRLTLCALPVSISSGEDADGFFSSGGDMHAQYCQRVYSGSNDAPASPRSCSESLDCRNWRGWKPTSSQNTGNRGSPGRQVECHGEVKDLIKYLSVLFSAAHRTRLHFRLSEQTQNAMIVHGTWRPSRFKQVTANEAPDAHRTRPEGKHIEALHPRTSCLARKFRICHGKPLLEPMHLREIMCLLLWALCASFPLFFQHGATLPRWTSEPFQSSVHQKNVFFAERD